MAEERSLALLTDLYQLTMAFGYWSEGLADREAVFHLFFRHLPFKGGFAIASGLEQALSFIERFRYSGSDLDYLSSLRDAEKEPLFSEAFLAYLAELKLSIDLDAMEEGTALFPQEPLVRVSGPILQCQLLETPLLNLINFSTLIATKAARVAMAARGDEVLEFGLRRAQGVDGALTASRAAFVGGCSATSNVLAGKLYGIPVRGTHSHSWVMAFEEELDSFYAFARALPNHCVFLVDTYDTLEGVKRAIEVGKWLASRGRKLLGVRLDSGDLAYLSVECRKLLDREGFKEARIFASNELDEHLIADLKRQGAQIAVWGVGTNLVTAKDQPALDGVYKLSAIRSPSGEWEDRLKLSEQMVKVSNPGILQVRRFFGPEGALADAVYDLRSDLSRGCTLVDPFDSTREKALGPETPYRDLLIPIYRQGELVYDPPSLEKIRENRRRELESLHSGVKRFINPHQYPVGMEKSLYLKKLRLIRGIRGVGGGML